MPESDKTPPQEISRTKRKNEMTALQKVGETLIGLSSTELENIPMSAELRKAVYFAQTLTVNEAKRRQRQYVGKLMRDEDIEAIEIALNRIQFSRKKVTDQFHQAEQWREKLIATGDTGIQEFILIQPQIDKQKLRQLIRKAQHDRKNNKNTGGETALFKFLREILKD